MSLGRGRAGEQRQPDQQLVEDQVEQAQRHFCDHAELSTPQVRGSGRLLEPHRSERSRRTNSTGRLART